MNDVLTCHVSRLFVRLFWYLNDKCTLTLLPPVTTTPCHQCFIIRHDRFWFRAYLQCRWLAYVVFIVLGKSVTMVSLTHSHSVGKGQAAQKHTFFEENKIMTLLNTCGLSFTFNFSLSPSRIFFYSHFFNFLWFSAP